MAKTEEHNKLDLSRYVSNLDRNVYTIHHLPEEVIAVIFAYVSRSPASFRENLAKLLMDDELMMQHENTSFSSHYSEKAARFHEKWVVGYGHSSVAEHAVAHIGIEKISRLASAELELANRFNSFTEYSQRYQRPQRGDFYIPPILEEQPELKEQYIQFQQETFHVYEKLLNQLIPYLKQSITRQENETERTYQTRIEKIAFEDARYVLTLATHTNLGMTGNGRALRDTLIYLLSSPYTELKQLAREMEREISQVIPTLLKYVKPNEYMKSTQKHLAMHFGSIKPNPVQLDGPMARFRYIPDYQETLIRLVAHLILRQTSLPYDEALQKAQQYSLQKLEQIAEDVLKELRFFDQPLTELEHIYYQMEFLISEANWHQLLRHNRRTAFTYGPPTISLGYTIPPRIKEANLASLFQQWMEKAEILYKQLESFNPTIAPYVVTNAHHRPIIGSASLWELYHLINLRTSPEAQWDIRETFIQLTEELKQKHPVLVKYAQRRLNQS